MNCVNHPDKKSIGICTHCKKPICEACKEEGLAMYCCKSCAEKLFKNDIRSKDRFVSRQKIINGVVVIAIPLLLWGIPLIACDNSGENGVARAPWFILGVIIGMPMLLIGVSMVIGGIIRYNKKSEK
jgi:hypothetical protein